MPDENGVIATHYRIDPTAPVTELAGGLRAYAVTDKREPGLALTAVRTRPDLPARPRVTLDRAGPPVPNAILPRDYGTGRDLEGKTGFFVMATALPGKALSRFRAPWRESELITCVLLPVATALIAMQTRGLTHRSINPDNLFRENAMEPATLGPFWAAPAGSLQPAAYEPIYIASCLPNARGNGTIADDVYALGVTLLVLASGKPPMAGLSDADILHRKMEVGSYAALTKDASLPPMVSDLLRSMLAEDPDHRPLPKMLLNPEQARARRVAAKPPRRAHTPLNIGGTPVFTSRDLAATMGDKPDQAYTMLRNGAVGRWLRRCLGDAQLGVAIDEVTAREEQLGGDDAKQRESLVMLAVCAIDPLAPLVWRGIAIQPDGLGPALVGATVPVLAALQDIVLDNAVTTYIDCRPRRPELAAQCSDSREFRIWLQAPGPSGGVKRLIYGANPMLPCASPLLGNRCVVRLADLLPALDEMAATADTSKPPIDPDIAAFIATRADSAMVVELTSLSSFSGPEGRLAVLRLYSNLEERLQPGPLPGLADWLLKSGFATLDDWRSNKRRNELEEGVKQATEAGQISGMLALVDNPAGRKSDTEGAKAAEARLKVLEAALADIRSSESRRAKTAQRVGHEMATGAGLLGLLASALSLALH
jgi:hypothetical protein